jgi:hypothetical protein
MPKLLIAVFATLFLSACGGPAAKCPGELPCGDNGCMPLGACCVPNGSGYCDSGLSCGADNMCHSGGGGGGGNTCLAQGFAFTCINNLCSPGLWCCHNGCNGCGCR